MMRAYRMEQPERCTQEGPLALMADRNPEYANKYNHSAVSRWETGQRMPSRADIETFGQALRLPRQETACLMRLAGCPTRADGIDADSHRHAPSDHQTLVSKDVEGDALQSRAAGSPGVANDYTIGAKYGLWRAAVPGFYIAGVGYALTAFGLRTVWILVAYVIIALGMMVAHGMLRRRGANNSSEFLFLSLFFLLNTPTLQSAVTGMDVYGFYSIAGFAGTPAPLLLTLILNLAISLVAVFTFDVLWKWHDRHHDKYGPYPRALRILLPPVFFVYLNVVILANSAAWIYFLVVLGIFLGVFKAIIIIYDERVLLTEWEVRLLMRTVVSLAIILIVAWTALVIVTYLYPVSASVLSHTLLHSWDVEHSALGYTESEFVQRVRVGSMWTLISSMAYAGLATGGYLFVSMYRLRLRLSQSVVA